MNGTELTDDGEAIVRDQNGFVVPHTLVSKYRSLQNRTGWWSPSAGAAWPELLDQARRKQYRFAPNPSPMPRATMAPSAVDMDAATMPRRYHVPRKPFMG